MMTPSGSAADISVEVSYAEPQRAVVITVRLNAPVTVDDVLRIAAAHPEFAGIDVLHSATGVFGKPTTPGQLLDSGDRVEIYRPLAADPKSARRARAKEARKKR